jgi:ADP-ribose pyrophosphatase
MKPDEEKPPAARPRPAIGCSAGPALGPGPAWEARMTEAKHPETDIVKSEIVHKGRIVDLQVDHVRLPSGRVAVREVVKHPGGVVVVPVMDDGRLLLVRQFRYPLRTFILEFPAGKLDSGQTPIETAKRELEEETGYVAGNMHPEFSFCTSPGFCDEVIHLFVATKLTRTAQRLEEGEHITVESYTVDECLRMIGQGAIADAKTILGLLWYRGALT